ncbi:MAG TPA: peptidoglycan DD-metalloendopeptidase family protein [Candidatus Binatia bacterium]|nr:peptidoglycan DD-metalloendopeptidase family protein [Candidatus Binatia bacterium]
MQRFLGAAWARRLAGGASLLVLVAFLAGAMAAAGMAALARGSAERARVPDEALYYVVVRSALADGAAQALAAGPGLRVVGDRSLAELLERSGGAGAPDRLRVIEVAARLSGIAGELPSTVAAMRAVDGVVDVIDVNARERAALTPERARRWTVAGALLALTAAAALLIGVARTAAVAVREAREEIAVRIFLGADFGSLWMPFAASLAIASCLGVATAIAAAATIARALEIDLATPGATAVWAGDRWVGALATLAALGAASAVAAAVARRAVGRLARPVPAASGMAAPAAAAAASAVFLLVARHPAVASADWANDPASLHRIGRELAVSRRALHQAEAALLVSEHRAVRAVAAGDPTAVRLAAAEVAVEAQQVDRWRASRDALVTLRGELRDHRRAERAPGPPIVPRLRPVAGGLEVGFGETAGRRFGRGFRNGVALRTRPGELVRATAAGRVAYAGELAGSGRVVVLSHGRRTYSVYARVGELLVARGMQVAPGEPIARASAEAGLLYFAVRERGRSVDPLRWLRSAGGSAGGTESS